MDAYQRRLRVEISDTAWAFFPLDTEGVHVADCAGSLTSAPALLHGFKARPGAEERTKKVFETLAEFVVKDSQNDIGKAMTRMDNAFFLAWEEAKTYTGFFVTNIAEYQASELAAKCNIKEWLHSNAYHDNNTRVAADSSKAKFLDVSLNASDENGITYAGSPVRLGSPDKLRDFLKQLGAESSPGMLGVFRTSPRIVGSMQKMFPFIDIEDMPIKLAEFIESKRKQGAADERLSRDLGLTGDEIVLAIIPPKD